MLSPLGHPYSSNRNCSQVVIISLSLSCTEYELWGLTFGGQPRLLYIQW